jgi:hypothetical protein
MRTVAKEQRTRERKRESGRTNVGIEKREKAKEKRGQIVFFCPLPERVAVNSQ